MIILEESLLIKLQWGYWGGPRSNIKEEEIKAQIEGRPCADTGRILPSTNKPDKEASKEATLPTPCSQTFGFQGIHFPGVYHSV